MIYSTQQKSFHRYLSHIYCSLFPQIPKSCWRGNWSQWHELFILPSNTLITLEGKLITRRIWIVCYSLKFTNRIAGETDNKKNMNALTLARFSGLGFCTIVQTIVLRIILLYLKSYPTFLSVKISRQLSSWLDEVFRMKTVLTLKVCNWPKEVCQES